jgi:hypothetical protein
MYADDTVLFFSSKNILEIENIMNSEAEQILAWIKENCLILNKKKVKRNLSYIGQNLIIRTVISKWDMI